MIAFIHMLAAPAEAAGIKVPPDPEDFNPEEFPHFQVFANLQLGAPTSKQLAKKGFLLGYSK